MHKDNHEILGHYRNLPESFQLQIQKAKIGIKRTIALKFAKINQVIMLV